MKKKSSVVVYFFILICLCGCDLVSLEQEMQETIKEAAKPNIVCTTDTQYISQYGYAYYIEGTCVNNSSKDYDYLQIEYICYDKDGNNLGSAIDNTNNLLKGQTWKFKAMSLASEASEVDYCDYHEVTGW